MKSLDLLCLVAHLNDDVLFGISAVFTEEIDAADIACAVFDADTECCEIVTVEFELGKRHHTDECFIDICPHVVDADFFEHAVLCGVGRPVGDGESASAVAVIAGASIGA